MFSDRNFLEHHELYTLEFKFLPEIFALYEKTKKNPGVNFDEMKLIDIKFIKNQFESRYIDWDTFKFEKKELTIMPKNLFIPLESLKMFLYVILVFFIWIKITTYLNILLWKKLLLLC